MTHDLAAVFRRGHQRLHRREAEDVDKDLEIARVGPVRARREAVVATGQHTDASLAHAAVRVDGERHLFFRSARSGGRDAVRLREREETPGEAERGRHEDPISRGFERVERFFV